MEPVDRYFASTAAPPYVAVIFTSLRHLEDDAEGYGRMAEDMDRLAAEQPGYLGIESARDGDGFGITVSYWRDELSAKAWKADARHKVAQTHGQEHWYRAYYVRIATVTRAYAKDVPHTEHTA
ncbi:polysaccharide biosynthesis protein [Iodidimonas gelatinilytica]|uniref:Polysaccharide biosynthesis protein n=1 Tax=Iodidimonas gelatinilytica TaxID=1236966 RepID=A0A5A7MUP3_9PROT|nr:antibiotic biosynthesis monooxygenase [Iodidimonas gelatinilytica]GEQ97303.1 polysaccharide biosynthesis protein [Iodidimonas gelatinilytica]GEQ99631.1 polysaccharide biosynthesis protein [Iodidimonas gelatinilytica]